MAFIFSGTISLHKAVATYDICLSASILRFTLHVVTKCFLDSHEN